MTREEQEERVKALMHAMIDGMERSEVPDVSAAETFSAILSLALVSIITAVERGVDPAIMRQSLYPLMMACSAQPPATEKLDPKQVN